MRTRQRLHAPQHEVAVERRRHRAGRVLREADALGQLVVVDGDEAADDVAVAAEVLRGRVHDDVGAVGQRVLQVRRGERVVDDARARPCAWASAATASMSMHVSSGLVGVSSHTMRGVGAASRVEAGEVGEVDRVSTGSRPGRAPGRSAGTCRRRRRCRARRDRRAPAGAGRCPRRPGPTRRRSPWAAPSSEATHASSAARVGLPERAYSKPWCSPTASWANVVDSVIGVTTAPRRGVGRLAGVDGPGLEARALARPRRCSPIAGARRDRNDSTSVRVSTRERPPAGQHEQRRGAVEHLDGERQRLADADGRQLRAHHLLDRRLEHATGRGRRRPSAPARRPRRPPRRRRTAARSCTPAAARRRGGASGRWPSRTVSSGFT